MIADTASQTAPMVLRSTCSHDTLRAVRALHRSQDQHRNSRESSAQGRRSDSPSFAAEQDVEHRTHIEGVSSSCKYECRGMTNTRDGDDPREEGTSGGDHIHFEKSSRAPGHRPWLLIDRC
jgi:hypothetical protein